MPQHLSDVQRECWTWDKIATMVAPTVLMITAMALASIIEIVKKEGIDWDSAIKLID